jgi:hypothetical protein
MKKITIATLAIVLSLTTTYQANANLKNKSVVLPTIAILDTAIDTTLPELNGKIVHEVCLLERGPCPNGGTVMEGPGAASMPRDLITRNGFDHGTQMAYVAVNNNPNINIVFVRIIGNNPSGSRQVATEKTLVTALQWVIENKDKWNIQAVSMSQGHHNLLPVVDYCPKTPITESKIKSLVSLSIPVFFAAGNNGNPSRIDWPSCITDSIAIGATMPAKTIASYSNNDSLRIDFFAQGTMQGIGVGGQKVNLAGTSAATQIAATNWLALKLLKPNLSYNDLYNTFVATADNTFNSRIKTGKLMNLQKAING